MKNKKLAVVVCGWHYSKYFYEQLTKQNKPDNWDIDYFCVSHRNPKYTLDEKIISKNSTDLYKQLDYFYYKETATIKFIEENGWKYIEKPNTVGDWGVYNQWIEDYNYQDYDVVFITGDDNFFIRNDLFECVLGGKLETWFSNGDFGNHTISEVPYSDDWLVVSNAIQRGRAVLRGSMEFFKTEILDLLGGKFDLSTCDSESRLNLTKTPTDYRDEISLNWNNQCFPFQNFIHEQDLYTKIRFLSPTFRSSLFCIEGERGLFSNNNVAPYAQEYSGMVQELYKLGNLNKFII